MRAADEPFLARLSPAGAPGVNYVSHEEMQQFQQQIYNQQQHLHNRQMQQLQHQSQSQQPLTDQQNTQTFQAQVPLVMPRFARQQLGAKNLIIRMLAEVYCVSVGTSGQARWQQLTGLVPVSLYSRTTTLWLNYLLTASNATNSYSGMSADSRQFLRLLQQYHIQQQQQQSRRPLYQSRSSAANSEGGLEQAARGAGDDQFIVFQVVAHEFSDGECRKSFNVKLIQPGTRLGRASDYLVYWKEHRPIVMNNTSAFDPNFATFDDFHIWGINFSSVNDAKLFYDICSLNLVDLDFNADYLQHFTTNLRQEVSLSNNIINPIHPPQLGASSNSQQQQQLEGLRQAGVHSCRRRQERRSGAEVQHHKPLNNTIYATGLVSQSCARCENVSVDDTNCLNSFDINQPTQRQASHQKGTSNMIPRSTSSSARTRSMTRTQTGQGKQVSMAPDTRSRSTPASPSLTYKKSRKRSSREQVSDGERLTDRNETEESHHPKCINWIVKQKEMLKRQLSEKSLRRSKSGEKVAREQTKPKEIESSLSATSAGIEAMPIGYANQLGTDVTGESVHFEDSKNNPGSNNQSAFDDEQAARVFARSRAANRRYTGVETCRFGPDEFFARHNARIARAQYANSKNMKEFLSLDTQTSPARKAELSAKFKEDTKSQLQARAEAESEKKLQEVVESQEQVNYGNQIGVSIERVHNVATTTEDLPLDTNTRNIMYSFGANNMAGERHQKQARSNRKVMNDLGNDRAQSLGPNTGRTKERDTRSLEARRRSLERTTCVDSEPMFLSMIQDGKARKQLSPINLVENEGNNSGGCWKSKKEVQAQRSRIKSESNGDSENYPQSYGQKFKRYERDLDQGSFHRDPHMVSSVPDFSQVQSVAKCVARGVDYSDIVSTRASCMIDSCKIHSSAHKSCLYTDSAPCSRQFHSCPNSLRKVRRNLSGQGGGVISDARVHSTRVASPYMDYETQPRLRHCCQSRHISHYLHCDMYKAGSYQVSSCVHKPLASCESCNRAGLSLDSCCQQAKPAWACQADSQSLKSSYKYGLYESDAEECDYNEHNANYFDDADEQAEHKARCRYCKHFSPRSIGYRAANLLAEPRTIPRPVDGYDQTMPRTEIKSKRRAKSQPPQRSTSQESEEGHLMGKSMENVQKLIMDVQNELAQLKSRSFGRRNYESSLQSKYAHRRQSSSGQANSGGAMSKVIAARSKGASENVSIICN